MLVLLNLQVFTDRQRRIEVLNAASERFSFFADTSRSAAMLRLWATIVFYDDSRKDIVSLLDGSTYQVIVSTDI